MTPIAELPRTTAVIDPAVQVSEGPQTLPETGGQGTGGRGPRIGLDFEDGGDKGGGNAPPLRPIDSEENPEARKHAEAFVLFWTTSNGKEDLGSFGFRQKPRDTTIFDIIQIGTPPWVYVEREKGLDSNLNQHTQLTDPAKKLLSLVHRVSSALLMAPEKIISLQQLHLKKPDIGIFTSDKILLAFIEGNLLVDVMVILFDKDKPSDLVRLAGEGQIQELTSRWEKAIKTQYSPQI